MPMEMEPIVSSETSAIRTQTPGNYPKRNKLHLEHGESLKTRIYLLIAIVFSPGGSGYFTCIQNMKLVTTTFKSGGLHEKHVVATSNLGNHLSISF